MRLHGLRMTAFEPFAGTEQVDFDALGEAGLFLLQGETGAGKTAILDAICFALFGHVPGVRDGAGRLRSDHSPPGVGTEVVLELTLAGRRVRITRSPKQERPKMRGQGSTEEPARALLELREPEADWSVLAERIEAVEHELAQLLGLTIGQFCQVVLLPQGAFARFLHASSDEREKILQQLFATDRYAAAEMWLADRRRAADAEVSRGLEAVADIVSRVAQVTGEEPPPRWREQPETLAGRLPGRIVLADAGEAAAEGRRDAAASRRDQAAADATAVTALAQRQHRHAAALSELARHQEGAPQREHARRRLQAAQRAAPAGALAERADVARATRASAEREAAALLQAASGQLAPAGAELTAEVARERALDLRQQAAVAGTFLEAERDLEHDQHRLAALGDQLRAAEQSLAHHQDWLREGEPQRQRLTAAVAVARDAEAALPGLERASQEARRAAEMGTRRDELVEQLTGVTQKVAAATEAELAAGQALLDARERRLEGIAAELAADLEPGQPCRVCGALEHPGPASPLAGERVDAAAERTLQRRLQAATQLRERERAGYVELERELAAARAIAGERPRGELLDLAREATRVVAKRRQLALEREAAEQVLSEHHQQMGERERQRAQAAETVAALRVEVGRRQAGLHDARERVRRARDGAETIAARVAQLERMARGWLEAAAALQEAASARREAVRAQDQAQAQARAQGFTTLADAVAAALPAPELERLQTELDAFEARRQRLGALVEDPELVAAAAEPPPDQQRAVDALTDAESELKAAHEAFAVAARQARELRELAGELQVRLEGLSPRLERQRLIRSVAALADGSSPANRMRMPLAAYVLTARLEQIAQAASERLESMSAGRYVLAHCDERLGRTRKAGLGLQVLDAWTGRERPPSSLSGGETFQASLALALGLADVVSAESGGARLETLFVDEGFGSLGDRALDDVLDVLDGLREGGRAVGVISHVAEMRQRIPAQLHVHKGRNGSRIVQS